MKALPLSRGVASFGLEVHALALVFARAVRGGLRMRPSDFATQLGRVALSALPLVGVAALFAGMVIALQTSMQLAKLGLSHTVADIVSVSVVRELAPVFTALLMAGKAGAGLASELGMVSLSGQAQAMRALSLDIDRELVAPRVWACVWGTLLLTIAAMLCGLIGGMVLGGAQVGLTPVHYMNRVVGAVAPVDLACGLFKGFGFGVLIALFGVRFGLRDKVDAAALGRHTMSAVVVASFVVLIADYVFTTFVEAVFA